MNKGPGRDYNEHMLSYLHWNYIYTNAHYYSKSSVCDDIYRYTNNLKDIVEINHESLKCLMDFVFLKTIKNYVHKNHKDMFDDYFDDVSSYFQIFELNELRSLYKIYKIMIKNIFYPWHFFRKPFGYLALKNIYSNEFYMHPYPHHYTDESYLLQLSSLSRGGIDGCVDKNLVDIYENTDFDINLDVHAEDFNYKDTVKKSEIEIKAAEIVKNLAYESTVSSDEIFEYNNLLSKYKKLSFDASSNFSRSVGLYLWEKIYFTKNKYDEKKVLDWFYKTYIYNRLNKTVKDRKKEYLGDKDEKILLKWLKKTNECIEAKNVLPFK